jgi:DNA-binding transcriptional MocR family regulator
MTENRLKDVWSTRDYPVLVEVTRRIDSGERHPRTDAIAQAIGLTDDQVQQAGLALGRRKLVQYVGAAELPVIAFTDVSAEAYFLTGLHPDGDTAVTTLLDLLRQAAEQTSDPAERSRIRALADQAANVSRSVLGGVLTAYLGHQLGA